MKNRTLLTSLREKMGLSIRELSTALDISLDKCLELEMSKTPIEPALSGKLEKFFRCPIDDLLLPAPPVHTPVLWNLMKKTP